MKYIFAILICAVSVRLQAQLQPGDMIFAEFNKENKRYVGETTNINDNGFSCRLLHSQAIYNFTNLQPVDGTVSKFRLTAKVASTTGGKYKAGTNVVFNVLRPDYNRVLTLADFKAMKTHENLVVKFYDGKNYLAIYGMTDELDIIKIKFLHTNSEYLFDQNGTIIKSGGTYPAGKTASFHPAKLMPSASIMAVGYLLGKL